MAIDLLDMSADVRRSIVSWLPFFIPLMLANRGWRPIILGVVEEICEEKLGATPFSLDWLIEGWNEIQALDVVRIGRIRHRPLIAHPDRRLRHLMARIPGKPDLDSLDDVGKFWYKLQLYLHSFCNKARASFIDIFKICCRRAVPEYKYWELFHFSYAAIMNVSPHPLVRSIDPHIFNNLGLIHARDLGCDFLGYSVHEILGALECLIHGETYCPYCCGCCEREIEDRDAIRAVYRSSV